MAKKSSKLDILQKLEAALEETLQIIDKEKLQWEAGETELSRLSDQELQSRLGLQRDEEELKRLENKIAADEAFFGASTAMGAPSSVDWRDRQWDGHRGNWLTNVKNQGQCGACVAFAAVGAIEARLKILTNNSALDINLSEAHLFDCGQGSSCERGWFFEHALNHCARTGICREAEYPYTGFKQGCRVVPAFVRTGEWRRLTTIASRKNALALRGPLIAGMQMYGDFRYYRRGIYRHVAGGAVGGHAVVVVGYDDAQQCWIVKNSWGPAWGEEGYFRIGYGDASGIDRQYPFYDFDIDVPATLRPRRTDPQESDGDGNARQHIPELKKILTAASTSVTLRRHLLFFICHVGSQPPEHTLASIVVSDTQNVLSLCPARYRDWFCDNLRRL